MRRLLLTTLLSCCVPAALHAQLPGGRVVNADEVRGQFLIRMQIELAEFLRSWEAAFARDASSQPRDHYLGSAFLLEPRGSFLSGPAVVDFLHSQRAQVSDAATSMIDYDASDAIAFVYGPYAFMPRDGDGTLDGGVQLSVLLKERLTWQVRAQLFLPSNRARALGVARAVPPPAPYVLPASAPKTERDRYDRAVATFAALRSAWAEDNIPASLFSTDALIRLPGEPTAERGAAAIESLRMRVRELGPLQTAVLDFAGRERLSYLMGRYYVMSPGGPLTGAYIVVLAVEGREHRVRALVME